MKRKILHILSFVVLATLTFFLVSCYQSKPGYMKDLTGTYELTKYTYRLKDAEADEDKDNMLKVNSIKAYLVISSDGTGYYVYKSNNHPLKAEEVRITYEYDTEETNKIREIYYTNGVSNSSSGLPGNGHESLGLLFKLFSKTLNMTHVAIFGNKYQSSVSYKRVSRKTDLSYVSKKMGETLSANEFEYNGLTGTYVLDYAYDTNLTYFILDLNAETGKANIYYGENGENKSKTNLDMTLSVKTVDNQSYAEIVVDGATYRRNINGNVLGPNLLSNNNENEFLMNYTKDTATVEEIIARYNVQ